MSQQTILFVLCILIVVIALLTWVVLRRIAKVDAYWMEHEQDRRDALDDSEWIGR